MSYQPLVYRKQGGDELVVASGGKITVESGGQIIEGAVASGTTTANLPAGGVSLVVAQTSGTGTNTYTLAAPVPGLQKWITATAITNASTDHVTVIGPTTTTLFLDKPKLRFIATGTVALIGRTTLVYDVVSASTLVGVLTT